MPAVNLTCDTLGDLNGGTARAVIDEALRAAVRDLEDRGDDDKPRKVQLTVTLTKVSEADVAIELEAKATVPAYKTAKTVAKISWAGKAPAVSFQQHNPERPDQETLPYGEKEKA